MSVVPYETSYVIQALDLVLWCRRQSAIWIDNFFFENCLKLYLELFEIFIASKLLESLTKPFKKSKFYS